MASKPRERELSCGHTVRRQDKLQMQRFLDSDRAYTLEEVLDLPINLNAMPFDFNRFSPTPLDPDNVQAHGAAYPKVALDYMMSELDRSSSKHLPWHRQYLRQLAEAEIEFQHAHRIDKNAETMRRWREYAASHPDIVLPHEDAEGVMQVRAGIAKTRAIGELAVRNPETLGKGIEILKSTNPFCFQAHIEARETLRDRIKPIPGTLLNDEDVAPYKFDIDEHNHALITKTIIGTVAVRGVTLEVVTRESGIMFDSKRDDEKIESMYVNITGHEFALAPLDITSYIRVARD